MFFTIKVITIQSTDKASELSSISFGMADVNQSLAFSFPSKVEVNQRDATLKRTFSNLKADLLLQNSTSLLVLYLRGEADDICVAQVGYEVPN